MNEKHGLLFLVLSIAVLAGLACTTFIVVALLDAMPGFQRSKCESPRNLATADFAGTWIAGLTNESDTLIIRQDNKYKQIIVSQRRNIDYQTGWQDWRLERDNSGLIYLHLAGMRVCGFDSLVSCEHVGYNGYDFCQDRSILMKGEGILLVLNNQHGAVGFDLLFPLGSEETWAYSFQKP